MNISTKSWHYRLIKFYNMRRPNDLCGYIRTLTIALLLALCCVAAAIGIACGLVGLLLIAPVKLIWSLFDPNVIVVGDAFAFGCMGLFMWAFVGVSTTYMYLKERKGWFQPSDKPKKSWLITEYIKAKHNKVCTMVNYQ